MTPNGAADEATGGHQSHRVTGFGRFLRKFRLDELPQLIHIFKGEMSLVGPRPPLMKYVEAFPEIYASVLKTPPGITGLATLLYHHREHEVLGKAGTTAETEQLYIDHCLPVKARLDRAYLSERSVCLNVKILALTLVSLFKR